MKSFQNNVFVLFVLLSLLLQCSSSTKKYHEGPFIKNVSVVKSDMISLVIQAGEMKPSALVKYDPQPEDSITRKGDHHGNITEQILYRNNKPIGWIFGENNEWLRIGQILMGDMLDLTHVDSPLNYSIISNTDDNYTTDIFPKQVFRKSKPNNWVEPSREFCIEHRVYLQLQKPLTSGNEYRIDLGQLNTEEESVLLKYVPEDLENEAIHISHIGFTPNDPGKRAYVSMWLGTGGALDLVEGSPFYILEKKSKKQVYSGKVRLTITKDQDEKMRNPKNFAKTNVYHLDFGDFKSEGEYQIYIEGLGCSRTFLISKSVWQDAMQTAMKGFLHIRANIELGPPYTNYKRPRGYYPNEHVTVYESDVPLMNTGNGLNALGTDTDNFGNLIKNKTDRIFNKGIGGYHDAGDWDRRIQHLYATRLQLELFELFPQFYKDYTWNIPESNNDLPDMIDEALFNLDFYKQLQDDHGGVRGGIEAAAHPVEGETSWLESLDVMVYSPGIWSSYWYAGVAARASFVLRDLRPELSSEYKASALKAMQWAEKEYPQWIQDPKIKYYPAEVTVQRNIAALELYRLTEDKKWHTVFEEQSFLTHYKTKTFPGKITDNTQDIEYIWDYMKATSDEYKRQRDAIFLYTLLDEDLANHEMKDYARALTIKDAQSSFQFQNGNSFNLTAPDHDHPLFVTFFAIPHSIQLCRGHYLTQSPEFLKGIYRSTNYHLGANPMNLVYMSGISENSVKNLFHIDSRLTGQELPEGLLSYGQFDWEEPMAKSQVIFMWPYTWFLGNVTTPDPLTWPVYESFYDIFRWPMQTEWTPMQDNGPNAYVWGYLAGINP